MVIFSKLDLKLENTYTKSIKIKYDSHLNCNQICFIKKK